MSKEDKNTCIHTAFDDQVPFDPSAPEKNLLRAVLLAALSDLRKQGEPRRQALHYFLSDDEDYLFSFSSICNFLNADPKSILIVAGLEEKTNRPLGCTAPNTDLPVPQTEH